MVRASRPEEGSGGAPVPPGTAAPRARSSTALRWLIAAALVGEAGVAALGVHGALAAGNRVAGAEPGTGAATAAPSAPSPAASSPAHAGGQQLASIHAATAGAGPRERGAASEVSPLLAAISKRQAELDAREKSLAAREERLQLYERDVSQKIEKLEEIEKRLQESSREAAAGAEKAAASLAKVYGAMRPAEAAPILERLDDNTVLLILGRMKEKEVGLILPLMTRDRAIVLTRSLVSRR